jgi:hypothetical protein
VRMPEADGVAADDLETNLDIFAAMMSGVK